MCGMCGGVPVGAITRGGTVVSFGTLSHRTISLSIPIDDRDGELAAPFSISCGGPDAGELCALSEQVMAHLLSPLVRSFDLASLRSGDLVSPTQIEAGGP